MRSLTLILLAATVAACQPAQPSEEADTEAAPARPSASGPASPATEAPPAYVGLWAADPSWCSNTIGPERPIQVTATEFQGYENTCQIADLVATDEGWTATFDCQAEGTTSRQPVIIAADADRLQITWVEERYDVTWRRCPA